MLFAVVILVLLWLFQYVFLTNYYETMKYRDLKKAAWKISGAVENGQTDKIISLAFSNSLCVVVTDSLCNPEFGENAIGSFSLLEEDIARNYNRYMYSLKSRLDSSEDGYIAVKLTADENKPKRLLYVTRSGEQDGEDSKYIFIESVIEPIEATAAIIKRQLIYITAILLLLAVIITRLISERVSAPLTALSETAERFAAGDYSVKFSQSEYAEIEQLSGILNNAGEEISKVTELRRDLIANVSHDLRTPLTIIKSYAEMIRDISGDNPEKREQHVQVIIDESDRLSNLVNSIMELSKLESSVRPLELKPFSVCKKLEEIMLRYKVLNECDGYSISLEAAEDRLCMADSELLEQAVYNLINNAVNYCGEDKAVIVRQINKEDCVRLEVEDHGRGIPSEQLEMIFDRYYRAPRQKRDVIGTGLGLSIVKEIFKQHGFPFGVVSEEGKGSVFWVEIALAPDEHTDNA